MSFVCVAAKAMSQLEKPSPMSAATGMASRAVGDREMPKMASTPRKIVAMLAIRKPIQASSPITTFRVLSGLARIAS